MQSGNARKGWLGSRNQSGRSERPEGGEAKVKCVKITHPGNALLTGKW